MAHFQRWTITLWLSCGLVIMTALILVFAGWNEAGLRTLVRSSAQTSVTFFLLAFSAASVRSLWPTTLAAWLVRNADLDEEKQPELRDGHSGAGVYDKDDWRIDLGDPDDP